jgi:sirohydrochlorin ferrochelatase
MPPYRGTMPPSDDTIVLLIAHGSRAERTTADHEALCRAVAEASGAVVRPAYLEISDPSIPDAIDTAVADGATTVRLVPHFLHLGNHVAADLPDIASAAADRHPGVQIPLEEHLGADPGLVDLLAARVRSGPATSA